MRPRCLEVAHEARLIDGVERADAHGDGGEVPELGHQPGVRVAGEAGRVAQLVAEVFEVVVVEAAEEVAARVDAGRGVALEVDEVAGLVASFGVLIFGVEEVVEADFEQRGERGVGGDVAADAGVFLVLAVDHGHGVPADEGFDLSLDGAVAGVGHLFVLGDGVAVGGGELAGGGDAGLAGAGAEGGEELGGVLPVFGDDIVEGFDPLGHLGGEVGLCGGFGLGRHGVRALLVARGWDFWNAYRQV